MRMIAVFATLMAARLVGVEFTITIKDETGAPLPEASVVAVLSRINDPRQSSMREFKGSSGQEGTFRFSADKDHCLIRIKASKQGHYAADADHRHGLGKVPSSGRHTLVLPHMTIGIPLVYKEVLLSSEKGSLPTRTWVGFDFALGDVVPPWGKGQVSDVLIWNEGEQIGWIDSAENIERLRNDPQVAQLGVARFALAYGLFRGFTRLRFDKPDSGMMPTPESWPYSALKMPPQAPADGYARESRTAFPAMAEPNSSDEPAGFFLRIRPRHDASGKLVSADYAKIRGRIESGYGWVAFRYYYNPTPGDRRLVFDLEHNLLKPAAGSTGPELGRYEASER